MRNPRVKHLVRLRHSTHRKRQGRFLVEGRREIERALQSHWTLETLYYCRERFADEGIYGVMERAESAGIECVQLTAAPFAKASLREHPDGLLAVARARERTLDDITVSSPALILIAEGIEKPGNIGALLRTADAAGVDGLFLCDPVADLYNPNAIRASQGSFFHVPTITAETAQLREWLHGRDIRVIATSPSAENSLWGVDLTTPVAIIVGAESTGLSPAWLEAPAQPVRLPMHGRADSLNVTATAAITLFEALRQRAIPT